MLELKNGSVVLEIREDLGAAVSRYDFVDGRSIFRPAPEHSNLPFDMACNLLIPWCNRISDGGFTLKDVFYPLAPNVEGDECALHGDAFQKEWSCIANTESSVTLELISDSVAPFNYRAEVTYTLEGADLIIALSVTNLSELELPYGLGLHPWFEQDEDTEIQAYAEQLIMSDEHNLPVAKVSIADKPELDFRRSKILPLNGLDNCYSQWNQSAVLTWPSRNMSVSVEADEHFTECHIYSKSRDDNFFCFEPVTHPVNAHNWPDKLLDGLRLLKQGQAMSTRCRFTPKFGA